MYALVFSSEGRLMLMKLRGNKDAPAMGQKILSQLCCQRFWSELIYKIMNFLQLSLVTRSSCYMEDV
jgi:hypothetical protein